MNRCNKIVVNSGKYTSRWIKKYKRNVSNLRQYYIFINLSSLNSYNNSAVRRVLQFGYLYFIRNT